MKIRISSGTALLQAMALVLLGLLAFGVSTGARADVFVTAVGNPLFVAADFHLFAAPVGTAGSGYAEFSETQQLILSAPNHVVNPVLGIGPGAAHAGPYDHEMADGVVVNGYAEGPTFTTAQYSNGSGVYLVFMLLPSALSPSGSSPDFSSGPILANALFPISVSGSTFTNGIFNDGIGDFQVPAINAVPGFERLDGHSHIPFFFADNFDFASQAVTGRFEYRISILDGSGNGYQIVAGFDVVPVPEPATNCLVIIGGLIVGAQVLRRRRKADAGQVALANP
jgi:hypothetical protein